MEVLWSSGERLTTRQVLSLLDGSELAYTTVATVLNNLVRKGMVERADAGRVIAYWPSRSRSSYASELMQDALRLSEDRESSFLHFVQHISEEDAALLKELLDGPSGERSTS